MQLSGGQRQRVAIGRAIVRDAAALPVRRTARNLDAQLRDDMRVEIKRLHQELGRTMIYVTHDQIEAMTLADRIALLRDGKIEQLGAPLICLSGRQRASWPAFLGSPKMNFLPATIETGEVSLRDGTQLTPPTGQQGAERPSRCIWGSGPSTLPKPARAPRQVTMQLPSTIELVQPTGSRVQVSMPLGESASPRNSRLTRSTAPGELVRIDIDMTRAVLIDPQTDKVI